MSRSGQKTANTRAKIAFPSTGPKTRLSIGGGAVVAEQEVLLVRHGDRPERLRRRCRRTSRRRRRRCRRGPRSRRPGRRRHAGRARGRRRHGRGRPCPSSVSAACTSDDVRRDSGSQNRYVRPCASDAPVAGGNRVGHRRPRRRARPGRGARRSRGRRGARRRMTTIASARMIQRSMAATLPRAAVAAPACFFLHAGRGLRSRQLGGDA